MTLAPTGKAAFLVGGNTIHSALHIPANQSLTYRRLDHDSLNTLRTQIENIKLWFIDEISMCGTRLFSFIHQRLQEVHNHNKPFGGSSVIAFGDLYQLPPVMDSFIFEDIRNNQQSDDYTVLSSNLWQQYFTMYELTTTMRQLDCVSYAQMLNRLREGNQTSEDLEMLQTRVVHQEDITYPLHAQHLFTTNDAVNSHNSLVFISSPSPKYTVKAVDTVVTAVSADITSRVLSMVPSDERKTMQLPTSLDLLVAGRYELSLNFNINDGLANGAAGTIRKVFIPGSQKHASGIVWIQFDDDRIGQQTRLEQRTLFTLDISPSWTPIFPVSRQFQVGRSYSNQILRKQFPLRQSAAKTVHRSQGDTLDQVVVDFSTLRWLESRQISGWFIHT
jgi:hypothetical protein